MKGRSLIIAALLGSLSAWGGEIVFTQPGQSPQGAQTAKPREPSRSEREAEQAVEKARQRSGRSSGVVVEDGASSRSAGKAEQAAREAQDYLRPGGEAAATETTVILKNAPPPGEAEKARMKARSYVSPTAAKPGRNCGEAATAVGMIGEGQGAERSANVFEKGNSSVNTQCK